MKSPKLKITVWKARDGFRWHMKRCGRIVAESGEGYKRIKSCGASLQRIIDCIVGQNLEWRYPTPK